MEEEEASGPHPDTPVHASSKRTAVSMPLSTVSKEGDQAPAGTTKVKRMCTRELIVKAAGGRGDEMSRVSDTVATGQAVPGAMRRRLKSSDLMRVAITASRGGSGTRV